MILQLPKENQSAMFTTRNNYFSVSHAGCFFGFFSVLKNLFLKIHPRCTVVGVVVPSACPVVHQSHFIINFQLTFKFGLKIFSSTRLHCSTRLGVTFLQTSRDSALREDHVVITFSLPHVVDFYISCCYPILCI